MRDTPVRIASFWYLGEAELARARLAMEGISSRLENSSLLLWDWQVANATGGIGLLVKESESRLARVVLRLARRTARGFSELQACPSCGELLPSTWQICWHCAVEHSTAQASQASVGLDSETPAAGLLAVIAACGVLALFAAGSPGIAAAALYVVLAGRAMNLARPQPEVEAADRGTAAGEGETKGGAASEQAEENAVRAWRAAVFGAFSFPPLLLYSLWLLLRMERGSDLSTRGRRRRRGALVLSLFTFLLWCLIVLVLVWPTASSWPPFYQLGGEFAIPQYP